MPSLSCYRICAAVNGEDISEFDDVVDPGEMKILEFGPFEGDGFSAKCFVVQVSPRPVQWEAFLLQGFPEMRAGLSSSPSALLVVKIKGKGRGTSRADCMFAFFALDRRVGFSFEKTFLSEGTD